MVTHIYVADYYLSALKKALSPQLAVENQRALKGAVDKC